MESFGEFYAENQGYFKDAGLDVKLIPGGQGIDQIQMVASGIAQLGIADASRTLAAIDKGAPLVVIAAEYQMTPQAMTCRKDSGVTTPAMLKGKRLAIKQDAQAVADLFLSKNGLTRDDMTTVAVGSSDISQIIAGKVDCEITTFAFNEPFLIEQAGVPVTVLPVGKFGMPAPMDAWIVTKDFLASHKQELAAFMTADAKAWDMVFTDPEGAAKFIVEGGFNDGLDIDQQTYQAKNQGAYMISPLTAEKGIFWIDKDVWKLAAENAKDAGLTKTVLDPDVFTTTEILEAATMPKH
tara:strand:+ start:203 stop:1087 length:885 start_codon:yes stop_codon:yes gene_type:complete